MSDEREAFTIRLPKPLHDEVARTAERLGVTRNGVVRMALNRYLGAIKSEA